MTTVTLFTLVPVSLEKLEALAIDEGLTMEVKELIGSKIVVEFSPDISAGQRTVLQEMLDAVGRGTISVP